MTINSQKLPINVDAALANMRVVSYRQRNVSVASPMCLGGVEVEKGSFCLIGI